MPLSKKTILTALKNNELQIKSVSSDAVDLLNGIVDRFLAALFPVDASLVLKNVFNRQRSVSPSLDNFISFDQVDMRERDHLPLDTIKKMIRIHAGNYTVPEDTLKFVGHYISNLIISISAAVIENNEIMAKYPEVPVALSGEMIVEYLMNTNEGKHNSLHNPPIGPLSKKMKSRKSKSRKSKSRKSKSRKSKSRKSKSRKSKSRK